MGNDRDAAAPALILWTWRVLLLAFLPLIAWSYLSRLQEVAHVPGQVMPSGSVHTIQHLEGGIVAEVLVKDNMLVERDQVLFRMDGTQNNAEREQLEAKIAGLQARAIRAKAFGNGTGEPDFSPIPAR
ncbi:MAG: biotin/lipoyl-binding protein, partial [Magnetococcales bacterium]|nr:biotin/lipoyl-binding protein [Magnetococcales bacterium]